MGVELHQLRYFVAVAEQRHFTKAAHELSVAQPSVSKQIRRLEDEFGAPLFHRMRGNVALTPAGEALLPLARRVLSDVAGAESEVRDLTGMRRGRLSVGATPSLSTTLVPSALARYHQSYPGIELALHEAGSRDLVRELEQGALDVALVILRDGYDLRTATLAACRRAGFQPTFALEGGEMDGVLGMTAAGLGVAVVPSLVVERAGPLRAVRIAKPELARTIGFAHRRDRKLTRAAQEFITTVRALVSGRSWLLRVPDGLTVLDHPSQRPR